MGAVLHARARGLRVVGAAREQRGREVARRRALAGSGRPVQQVRVGRAAVERSAEHGRRMRVLVEHPVRS